MSTITKDPLMDILTDRISRELDEEFIRQTTELYKQTDRYKEYLKRKQAEQDSAAPKED